MKVNITTKDVRGNEYKCDESVCVEMFLAENEQNKAIDFVLSTNLEVWFKSDIEDGKGLIVLWQGETK